LWSKLFDSLLNIPSNESQPDLSELRDEFEKYFFEKYRTKFMASVANLNNLCSKHKM
jgi:hypothetical protein